MFFFSSTSVVGGLFSSIMATLQNHKSRGTGPDSSDRPRVLGQAADDFPPEPAL